MAFRAIAVPLLLLLGVTAANESQDSCSLHAIEDNVCGQSDLDCKYTPFAKEFKSELKDGTCASQGYTVKGSSQTMKVPVVGEITVTKYTKPSEVAVSESCSLFAIEDDVCGQSDLDCKYAPFAKKFKSELKDGTCASQGYTVKGSTQTMKVPVVGEIAVTKYTKPSEAAASESCSLFAIEDDVCGQSDLDCKYAPFAKKFKSELKDGTCASQGYTVKGSTQTMKVPVVGEITVTKYTKPSEVAASESCSLFAIEDDVCGQSDLDCKYAPFAKKFKSELKDGTCASQGYTVKGSTQTMKVPVVGEITVTKYTKPSEVAVSESCSLFAIEDDVCGQSDLDCKYAPFAKKFKSELKDGTCASQGYTVNGSTQTMKVPVVGEITVTKYTKPSEILTQAQPESVIV